MRARSAVLLASLLVPAAAPLAWSQEEPADEPGGEELGDGDDSEGGDDRRGKRGRKGREQNPEDEALLEAVESVLHANSARMADDGRLELHYTFKSDEELIDWELAGFDRAEEGGRRGRRRGRGGEKGKNLTLGVSSNQQGLLRHKLELSGDFEVQFKLRVLRSTTGSDLVLGVGKAGARYGTQLVKRRSSGFSPLRRRSQVDKDAFAGGRTVTITLTRSGGDFSTRAGGGELNETNDLSKEAEGQPLLFATDMLLVLDEVVIKAYVDAEDVYALGFE